MDEDNALKEVKDALDELSNLLSDPNVQSALSAIGPFLAPVITGLKEILGFIKDTLKELLEKLEDLVKLDTLFSTITKLLDAAKGLAPDQQTELETVGNVVGTIQDFTDREEIQAVCDKIDEIIAKLEAI